MRQSNPSPTATSPATGRRFEAAPAAVTPQPTVSDAPQGDNLLSYLTPADRQLLQAATGYEISSDGQVMNPGEETVDSLIVEISHEQLHARAHLEPIVGSPPDLRSRCSPAIPIDLVPEQPPLACS